MATSLAYDVAELLSLYSKEEKSHGVEESVLQKMSQIISIVITHRFKEKTALQRIDMKFVLAMLENQRFMKWVF